MNTRFLQFAATALSAMATLASAQGSATAADTFKIESANLYSDAPAGTGRRVDWKLQLNLSGSEPTAERARLLAGCLAQPGVLEFGSLLLPAEGLLDVNADAPPFRVHREAVKPFLLPERIRIEIGGDAPERFRAFVKFHLDSSATAECRAVSVVDQEGKPAYEIHGGADPLEHPFKGKFQLGSGGGGASFEFQGSRIIAGSTGSSASFTTLEASGKLPIGKPSDVRHTPGAAKDASKDIPDAVNLSLNHSRYQKGGRLERLGLRLRATGTLRGAEAVAYWSPLFGWFDNSHGFYGAEAEGGWRKGDAEFKNLTTRKPDIGHTVARLGAVGEWAPKVCLDATRCINNSLSQGLRFYVRGRLWVDSYREPASGTKWRARPFFDSELFYNFEKDSRIFLRAETGYLPPDLSTRSRRIYIGVGQAF